MSGTSCTLLWLVVALLRANAALYTLFAINSAASATTVGGFITTDTHWQIADSPFIASSSILIDSGAKLTIDPGVEVRFAPSAGLVVVDGTLSARGTSEQAITFTADQAEDVNRWNGIRFGDDTVDAVFDSEGNYLLGSIIEQANVTGVADQPNGSIRVESSNPFIHASNIHDNLSNGILIMGADGLRIVSNQFRSNVSQPSTGIWGGGIRIKDSIGVLVADNEITDNLANGAGGVYVFESENTFITGNVIADNLGATSVTILRSSDITLMGNRVSGQQPRPSGGLSGHGVTIDEANNIEFRNNFIHGNDDAGLVIEDSNGISLEGDEIVDNVGDGILLSDVMGHSGIAVTNVVISANPSNPTEIAGNGGFQIYNDQFYELTTDPLARGNVDARNVWWGTMDVPPIEAGVFDFFDDSFKGIVFLDPIALSEPIDGDYNLDGVVDAADYTVWRDNLGALAGTLPNDVDGSVIGPAQYDTWKANFGNTLTGSNSLSDATVPEPTTLVLTTGVIAFLVALSQRGTRIRRDVK